VGDPGRSEKGKRELDHNQFKEEIDIVETYGVSAFPTKILLDTEGKVIQRCGGSTPDLKDKLKEIFSP
jgi:thioredoxin-related protein